MEGCIALYCIVLYCIVLSCTVLYCTVLYYIVLSCVVLYCIVYYIIWYYTLLQGRWACRCKGKDWGMGELKASQWLNGHVQTPHEEDPLTNAGTRSKGKQPLERILSIPSHPIPSHPIHVPMHQSSLFQAQGPEF
jgi:hypothetical protein